MTTQRIIKGSLAIDKILFDFIENEALPILKLDSDTYWRNFEQVCAELTPKIKPCLPIVKLQAKIDDWHKIMFMSWVRISNFTSEIGYLEPGVADFTITTENVDRRLPPWQGPSLSCLCVMPAIA